MDTEKKNSQEIEKLNQSLANLQSIKAKRNKIDGKIISKAAKSNANIKRLADELEEETKEGKIKIIKKEGLLEFDALKKLKLEKEVNDKKLKKTKAKITKIEKRKKGARKTLDKRLESTIVP